MFNSTLAKSFGAVALSCALILSASSAQALVTGSNAAEVVAPPSPAVTPGFYEASNLMRVFYESTTTLGSALSVDVAAPGGVFSESNTSPGSIAAGMEVDSYLIHFDPIGGALDSAVGEFIFTHDVIGLIFLNSTLDASDFLGAPGTAYPTGMNRGFDPLGDQIVWLGSSVNGIDVSLLASTGIDQIRVITKTPEPATYALLGFGVLLAVMLKRRKPVTSA